MQAFIPFVKSASSESSPSKMAGSRVLPRPALLDQMQRTSIGDLLIIH